MSDPAHAHEWTRNQSLRRFECDCGHVATDRDLSARGLSVTAPQLLDKFPWSATLDSVARPTRNQEAPAPER